MTHTLTLNDALSQARLLLPGWAYDHLAKAAAPPAEEPPPVERPSTEVAGGMDGLLKWAEGRYPVELSAEGPTLAKAAGPSAATEGQLKAFTRQVCDMPGALTIRASAGEHDCRIPVGKAMDDLALVVPSSGPARPLIAFVGVHPSPLDAARGEPFCGPDGRVLVDHYLAPLGLAKGDVLLTHLLPVAGESEAPQMGKWVGWVQKELERYRPTVVVALGKHAKEALGNLAHFVMPHPAAIRRRGDTGEVVRKVRMVKDRLETLRNLDTEVRIVKADPSQHIVVGVPLDPYQFDTQDDWTPAKWIEKTAHGYLTTSRVVGLQHMEKADAEVVESHLVHYPSTEDYQAAMLDKPHRAYRMKYGNQTVHSGAWVLATRINDPGVWSRVEKGEITAYSIGGVGVRTPVDRSAMPKVEFIDVGDFKKLP